MSRLSKQIVIAVIFLLIIAILVLAVYFLIKPKATCYDGIQNQGEEKVDCGGPCPVCEEALKDVEVLWAKSIDRGQNYDLVARVRNPNLYYGISSLPYQFHLLDSQGEVIFRKTSKTFILPGQDKYLIDTSIEPPAKPVKAEIIFGNFQWERFKDFEEPIVIVRTKEYQLLDPAEPGFSRTSGVVINKSDYDFSTVGLNVVLYDGTGRVIGVNETQVNNLLSSEERYFEATWFSPIDEEPRDIDIEPEINIFQSETFMRRFGIPEKYQQYQQ